MKNKWMKAMQMLLCATFFILHSSFFISCSEEETETSEWDNWQERNETYFASLPDLLSQDSAPWMRIKSYSLDPATEGKPTDYVYAKIIEQGSETECPAYTDSVRVVYQGRLIPTNTYPEGSVFSSTVSGNFSVATASTSRMLVSKLVEGMATALQHMHRGDYWRIYIPHELGYDEQSQTSSSGSVTIPAYSTLIFDVLLVDFAPTGETLPSWSSRRR